MDDPPERGTVHRDFRPATKALVGALVVVSNVVGAAIVLAVAGWLLPTQSLVPDLETTLDRNLWAFGFYLAFAVVVGLTWGFLWVHVPPQPDPDAGDDVWRAHGRQARSAVLAAPLRITVVQAVPWIVAVAALRDDQRVLLADRRSHRRVRRRPRRRRDGRRRLPPQRARPARRGGAGARRGPARTARPACPAWSPGR